MDILRKTLNNHQAEYIDHLKNIVAIDTSVIGHGIDGGKEKDGQAYLVQLFEKMKAKAIIQDPMEETWLQKSQALYQEGNLGHNHKDRFNVYATFGGKTGKTLMFNGHMDTMPAGDVSAWSAPPHSPTLVKDCLQGLGVCDMKSGLMASIMAVKLIQDAGIDLPGDVIISSVVDEEGGGNGSIQAAMQGVKADAVIVCEPTNYQLIAAHMGFVFFEITVEGKAVHSGSKIKGVSAIDKAYKIIQALEEMEHNWLLTYKHTLLPAPNSNVGVIYGGTAGSTTADKCTFKTCVHYLPEVMTYDSVVAEYKAAIYQRCEGDSWLKEHKPSISIYQAGGAFEMELDHVLVDTFKTSFAEIMGKNVEIVGSPAGCDSRTWKNIAKLPTLQFGPGTLEQCHAVDEKISIQQYLDAILIYAQLILNWGKTDNKTTIDKK